MKEVRYLDFADAEPLEVEERSGAAPKIRGRAIVYNSRSKDLGGFPVIISHGAFDHILARQRPKLDVVALWNHDASQLLGRTTSGTLRLIPDDRGVAFELDPPDTTLGRDLMTLCRRGDIAGCSFAFTVSDAGQRLDHDDEGKPVRYIERADGLFDVSLVTNPAYGATAVSVRSLADMMPAPPAAEPVPLSPADQFNLARAKVFAKIAGVVLLALAITGVAEARPRRGYSYSYSSVPAGGETSTAQGVAEIQARLGRVGHFGGNRGYEGCGSGPTPEAALRSCCYSNSGMIVVDKGVARGRGGQWYACKRYL